MAEAQEKAQETTKKRPRISFEEITERKVSMAKERNSRVARIDSTLGNTLFNIMRQFDQAYAKLKGNMGEFGGTSHEKGMEYMNNAHDITLQFSELTKKLCKEVNFRYYTPRELEDFQAEQKETK